MKRFLLLAPILAALAPAHAAPPLTCDGSTLCSRTFYASGECNGQDSLATLTIGDTGARIIEPWEPVPITIVGAHIVLTGGSVQYAFAGNSYAPDVMRWLDERDTFYPAGVGFAFPAFGSKEHLDLHYACAKGAFQAFYTVYYKVEKPTNTASIAEAH